MRLLRRTLFSLVVSFAPCICLANENSIDESNTSERQVITVTLEQAKRLHELGATFIDTRSDDEWKIGHIDKALHYDFHNDLNELQNSIEIKKTTPLVFYCESSECLKAAYASAVSLFWGYDQVFYFQDGYYAWLLKDYPVTQSRAISR